MNSWKAKPGKLDEYNRYIHNYAALIDGEARRRGAFNGGKPSDHNGTIAEVYKNRVGESAEPVQSAVFATTLLPKIDASGSGLIVGDRPFFIWSRILG